MTGGRVTLQPAPVNDVRDQFGGIFAGIMPFLPPPNDDAVKTQDIQVRKDLRVRTYVPTGLKDPLPVGLYRHCGGWFTGSIEGEDHLCRNIAESSQIILVSPEYRLAPEHPYPAGLDDCCATYEWMHASASKYGGDHKKIFIMGGSAGGNLAACVALKYASDPELRPSGLILACLQSCDVEAFPESYKKRFTPEEYADSAMIGRELMIQAVGQHTCFPL